MGVILFKHLISPFYDKFAVSQCGLSCLWTAHHFKSIRNYSPDYSLKMVLYSVLLIIT